MKPLSWHPCIFVMLRLDSLRSRQRPRRLHCYGLDLQPLMSALTRICEENESLKRLSAGYWSFDHSPNNTRARELQQRCFTPTGLGTHLQRCLCRSYHTDRLVNQHVGAHLALACCPPRGGMRLQTGASHQMSNLAEETMTQLALA